MELRNLCGLDTFKLDNGLSLLELLLLVRRGGLGGEGFGGEGGGGNAGLRGENLVW